MNSLRLYNGLPKNTYSKTNFTKYAMIYYYIKMYITINTTIHTTLRRDKRSETSA